MPAGVEEDAEVLSLVRGLPPYRAQRLRVRLRGVRASKEITKKHYIVKPALAPNSSHILEQLGASLMTTSPEPGDRGPSRAA